MAMMMIHSLIPSLLRSARHSSHNNKGHVPVGICSRLLSIPYVLCMRRITHHAILRAGRTKRELARRKADGESTDQTAGDGLPSHLCQSGPWAYAASLVPTQAIAKKNQTRPRKVLPLRRHVLHNERGGSAIAAETRRCDQPPSRKENLSIVKW
eukprot:CAMPEP_0198136014 /NCGR_PEP_ID=MMETSP1442-20131203/60889_1 /TAXON_ID= /ORGANISM="Craspedostauros australis, Strain CCMP3328" /LENGTH=153 /DNA_ID=CAMNT_0043797207 /DNA_START=1413 /DNA_END=1871 /DNA_ORIENTATION=-